MKKLIYLLVLTSFMFACTNIIITKGATTTKSNYLTYSADSYSLYGALYHFSAGVYPNGTMLDIYEWDTGKYLGKIKQAERTYNVIGNMNEFQLTIGETTFGGRLELQNKKGILDYGSLIYVTLQRAKNAKEAIQIMTSLVEEYGYYSTGESFSIVDPNEAWILEMIGKGEGVKGAIWVAQRIPDGYISAHANQARITKINFNDKNNFLYSSDVISFAREKGYFNGKDEDFSFSDVYNPLDFGGVRYCEARVWSVFRRVNKHMEKYFDYINFQSKERMPLYIKPDRLLSTYDIIQLMRDHYEGTELDMTKGVGAGLYCSPYRNRPLEWKYKDSTYFHERPISTQQTGFSFVAQMRSHLPNEVGGVLWFGVDDTYMTVYMPFYPNHYKVPECLHEKTASLSKFSWNSAFWIFNVVSNFVYLRYSAMIDDLKKKQTQLEASFMANQEMVEQHALVLLKNSRKEAIEYLNSYSNECVDITMREWKDLFEFLMIKYVDGADKNEYFRPTSKGYPEETRKRIVEENPNRFKVIEIPYDLEIAYFDLIREVKDKIKDKKYIDAIKQLNDALKWNYRKDDIQNYINIIKRLEEEFNKSNLDILNIIK
ncbi:MAG TPA: C69 family dipeptidase [Ignavibacteriales bacterium]|nr:C69 family dipeptidase [Ignavibacteriales bacterium]HPP33784.1 C69 family dipeptidase [Ignavibacteriales bacterium]